MVLEVFDLAAEQRLIITARYFLIEDDVGGAAKICLIMRTRILMCYCFTVLFNNLEATHESFNALHTLTRFFGFYHLQ